MTPRVVIAGTSSGAGKTSIACGVMGALRARGLRVQGFKVGPDYIDPSHHAAATGRPGRNLDAFISGPELIAPLARHGARGADIAVIEGVMGLFDGASGRGEYASTAHVAKLLGAPVLLVVDASAMARSVGAVVHGYRTFDPELDIAGVILNRVGSDHHDELLRAALAPLGVPVVGSLRRETRLAQPERHLGLIPADERRARAGQTLEALADAALRGIDLDGVLAVARAAGPLTGPSWSPERGRPVAAGARIAIAAGPAFSFHYRENLELLTSAGAELVPFDPLVDERLPAGARALILAGGFPEVYGAELAANVPLRTRVAAFARAGNPVLAECGGLLYLCAELDGHEMCGVLPARARMTDRLTLGYREATAIRSTPCALAGERFRGHEFHYSRIEIPEADHGSHAWTLRARGGERREGFATGSLQASYLHAHWAAFPQAAVRLARAAADAGAVAA